VTDAFRTELVALLPRLRRFAIGLTTDTERADDLVQAACERALTKGSQWQAGTRLDSWMFKIVQNLWIDQLRGQSRIAPIEDEQLENFEGEDFNARIEAQITLEMVLKAMAKLPPPMRSILMLVCVEGVSYQDAATILEVPIGTVMSRLARARLAVHRALLNEQDRDHGATH